MNLLKSIFLPALLNCLIITSLSAQCGDGVAYVRTSTQGEPWTNVDATPSNVDAMDTAFGAGNWDALFFETLNPSSTFLNNNYGTLFIEGSSLGAIELNTFLITNLPAIENFVSNGGSLLLNAAPNEGGSINFGFGGITLVNDVFTNCAVVSNTSHPIIQNGLSAITHYTSLSFGHAIICPPSMSPNAILEADGSGNDILVELSFGGGTVIFGGMTIPFFHCATTSCDGNNECNDEESNKLRSNILTYLSDQNAENCTAGEPIPTMGEWGLLCLGLILLICGIVTIKERKLSPSTQKI